MTQGDMVIQYIKDFGSITSWEAFQDLGITRLSGRIFDLKQRGWVFKTESVTRQNRYNKPVTFAKYSITMEGDK